MSENLYQLFTASPATTMQSTDLLYLARSPYNAADDFAITFANFLTSINAVKLSPTVDQIISGAYSLGANNLLPGVLTVASSGGTTTLTKGSPQVIIVTGTFGQTIQLPDVSTLTSVATNSTTYTIISQTSNQVTLTSSGGNTISSISSGAAGTVYLLSNAGTDASSWFSGFASNAVLLTPSANQTIQGSFVLGADRFNAISYITTPLLRASNGTSTLSFTGVTNGNQFINITNGNNSDPIIQPAGVAANIGVNFNMKGTGLPNFKTASTTSHMKFTVGSGSSNLLFPVGTSHVNTYAFPDKSGGGTSNIVVDTQVQQDVFNYAVATAPDTYTVTLSPVVAAYTDALTVLLQTSTFGNATNSPTLAVNGLATIPIKLSSGALPVVGDMPNNTLCILVYNDLGGFFELINPAISYVSAQTVQSNALNSALDTGTTANNYIVASLQYVNTFTNGILLYFKAAHTNTGASGINVSGNGYSLYRPDGSNLAAGDIVAGQWSICIFDVALNGFVVLNPYSVSLAGAVVLNPTADQLINGNFKLGLYSLNATQSALIGNTAGAYASNLKGVVEIVGGIGTGLGQFIVSGFDSVTPLLATVCSNSTTVGSFSAVTAGQSLRDDVIFADDGTSYNNALAGYTEWIVDPGTTVSTGVVPGRYTLYVSNALGIPVPVIYADSLSRVNLPQGVLNIGSSAGAPNAIARIYSPTTNLGSLAIQAIDNAANYANILTHASTTAARTWELPNANGTIVLQGQDITASSLTFNPTTQGIVGVTNGSTAAAGYVGELISSVVASVAAVTIVSSNVPQDVTAITLPAGDWDVWGSIQVSGDNLISCIVSISATTGTLSEPSFANLNFTAPLGVTIVPLTTPSIPVNSNATVTLYLVTDVAFVTNAVVWGSIYARRRR